MRKRKPANPKKMTVAESMARALLGIDSPNNLTNELYAAAQVTKSPQEAAKLLTQKIIGQED